MAGLYFEEFFIGQTFKHAIRRTVSEMDNVMFSALTHNPAALHLDEEYCKNHTEYGQRIVNSGSGAGGGTEQGRWSACDWACPESVRVSRRRARASAWHCKRAHNDFMSMSTP